jgi:hypothetical protein
MHAMSMSFGCNEIPPRSLRSQASVLTSCKFCQARPFDLRKRGTTTACAVRSAFKTFGSQLVRPGITNEFELQLPLLFLTKKIPTNLFSSRKHSVFRGKISKTGTNDRINRSFTNKLKQQQRRKGNGTLYIVVKPAIRWKSPNSVVVDQEATAIFSRFIAICHFLSA